jgi:hypothetical protein
LLHEFLYLRLSTVAKNPCYMVPAIAAILTVANNGSYMISCVFIPF